MREELVQKLNTAILFAKERGKACNSLELTLEDLVRKLVGDSAEYPGMETPQEAKESLDQLSQTLHGKALLDDVSEHLQTQGFDLMAVINQSASVIEPNIQGHKRDNDLGNPS